MQIPLSAAIDQLRDELRKAILEGKEKDIVFTPKNIELELAVTFAAEVEGGAGFKLLALLDLSTKAKASDSQSHKIKLEFDVCDRNLRPIKVRDKSVPTD
jgi:Trypsin-co-occurring domain 2